MEHPSTQGVYKGSNNQAQKLQESKKSRKDKKRLVPQRNQVLARLLVWGVTSLVHFPKLFRFCRDKETSVVELMKFSNGVLLWDVTC